MITCRNISKSFGDTTIFTDFSYTFNNTGLYVLFGASGSGKTTFLHILLGIMNFDDGEIIFDDKKYKSKVNYYDIQSKIAYLSQECYFIDYLTMKENLLLATSEKEQKIIELAKKFDLEENLNKYPNQISGGEKSRFSLIISILKGNKILLLDEPTASLDEENRKKIYNILNKLKSEYLIICATHDSFIFNYEPNIIDFNNLEDYKRIKTLSNNKYNSSVNHSNKNTAKETFVILKYLIKQIPRCEKKLIVIYTFIFTLSLMLIFSCTDYEMKVFSNLVDNYNLRSVRILCSLDSKDYCTEILSKYNVSEKVYHYLRNLPISTENENQIVQNDNFEFDILSLPFKKENINNSDNLLIYGNYYKNENDIILGIKKAEELSNAFDVDLKNLIGKKIELTLPDGVNEFNIVGIFKKIKSENNIYFKSMLGQYDFDDYYYVNQKFEERYLEDEVLGMEELSDLKATSFTLFFESKKDFLTFYNTYKNKDLKDSYIRIFNPTENFVEYYNTNELMKGINLVSSIAFLILTMLFYYQIHKTRLIYSEVNYSIYEYYGYKEKNIRKATVFYFMIYIFIILIISMIISSLLSLIINKLILYTNILPFPLFVFDLKWCLLMILLTEIISFFEAVLLNHSRKKKGWFYLIKEKSDLI